MVLSFSLKILLISLGSVSPPVNISQQFYLGCIPQSCKVLGTHHYSAGNIYCSSCSALFRNRKKLLWRPQSVQTCLLSQKNGLMQKCWLLGTKYSRHRVPEQYQHTKLLCNYLIFSSTYNVFLFPVCKYVT